MAPRAGHTWGHRGIAIRQNDRWLLHAGDAHFYRGGMDTGASSCMLGLRACQTMMEVDRVARLSNQKCLRGLIRAHRSEMQVVCADDQLEFAACAGRMQGRHNG